MYNTKTYTNKINKLITSGGPLKIYTLENDVYFIGLPHTTHFIHASDLTPRALEIVQVLAVKHHYGMIYYEFIKPECHFILSDIKLAASFTPKEKSSIKRMLMYSGRFDHFLNEKLLKRFDKPSKLLLSCEDRGKFDVIFVYRDNGEGWINAEYLGTICAINPKMEAFEIESAY